MDFIINISILGITEDGVLTTMFLTNNKDLSVGHKFYIGKLLMVVTNVVFDNNIINYVAHAQEPLNNKSGTTLEAIYNKINHTTLTIVE